MKILSLILAMSFFSEVSTADELFNQPRPNSPDVIGTIMKVPPKQELNLQFQVEKFVLKNGMTVLLHENHSIPMISYQTWFRVGSKDEPKGESGIAHMLEHMMFKGAKKYTDKDFDKILHENGIVNNAFTSFDYTGYYENLPSSKLELIMDVEVDRLKHLALKNEHLHSEREVVKEERRLRVENDPSGRLWEEVFASLYRQHPYGVPVIGLMEDVNNYTTEKLRRFFSTWYTPANAVLVIVGDFKSEEVKRLVRKYYEPIESFKVPEKNYAEEKPQDQERRKILEQNIKAPQLVIAYQAPVAGSDDSYALDILAQILGLGKSSRLFQELVYKQQSCLSVYASNYSLQQGGVFSFGATLKPGQDLKKVEQAIERELERVIKGQITQRELEKAKNGIASDYVDSLLTIDGKARILAMNEILFGDYREFFRDLSRYNKVTLEDLKSVSKKYFKPEKRNVLWMKPEVKVGAVR